MPLVLRRKGYHFMFFASDKDEPPHVHVKKNGKAAKFWLAPIVMLESNHGFAPTNGPSDWLTSTGNCYWSGGMTFSANELDLDVRATGVAVTDETITVALDDGRTIVVPTSWYPRLKHASRAERENYEFDGYGVSWPEIEADFSIRGLLLGRKSGESPESFKFWLD